MRLQGLITFNDVWGLELMLEWLEPEMPRWSDLTFTWEKVTVWALDSWLDCNGLCFSNIGISLTLMSTWAYLGVGHVICTL